MPALIQGSQPPQLEVWIGALVYASDASVNVSGRTRVLVSYTVAPPLGAAALVGGYLWPVAALFLTSGLTWWLYAGTVAVTLALVLEKMTEHVASALRMTMPVRALKVVM